MSKRGANHGGGSSREHRRDEEGRHGERREREGGDEGNVGGARGRDDGGRRATGRRGGRRGGKRRRARQGAFSNAMSLEEIRSSTDQGTLLPSSRLVKDIILTFRPAQEQAAALLGQVELAHRRNEVGWLSSVAWEAQEGWGREWIEENIGPIPSRVKKVQESKACREDIRKKTDPTLESRVEDASELARQSGQNREVDQFIEELEEVIRDAAASCSRPNPSPSRTATQQMEQSPVATSLRAAVASSALDSSMESNQGSPPQKRQGRERSEGCSTERRSWRNERGTVEQPSGKDTMCGEFQGIRLLRLTKRYWSVFIQVMELVMFGCSRKEALLHRQ